MMSEAETGLANDMEKIVSGAFVSVLAQSSGGVWKEAEVEGAPGEVAFVSDFRISGAKEGLLRLECGVHDARLIARVLLGGEEVSHPDLTPDEQEAVEEFFRQVIGLAKTACSSKYGELKISPVPWDRASEIGSRRWMGATSQDSRVLFAMSLDAALQESFLIHPSLPAPVERNSNLDLLMNVTLPVMMRFGERQMRLHDILELGSGAVVELNRKESDPVELLLDNKLIARGEVVIVEGNYGFRVLEVASPRERIQAATK